MSLICENEKALGKQGLVITTEQTKAQRDITEDYQSFSEVAIICSQSGRNKLANTMLRVTKSRQQLGIRLSINGRDGRSECLLTSVGQIDDLMFRLTKLKNDVFIKSIEVTK